MFPLEAGRAKGIAACSSRAASSANENLPDGQTIRVDVNGRTVAYLTRASAHIKLDIPSQY